MDAGGGSAQHMDVLNATEMVGMGWQDCSVGKVLYKCTDLSSDFPEPTYSWIWKCLNPGFLPLVR